MSHGPRKLKHKANKFLQGKYVIEVGAWSIKDTCPGSLPKLVGTAKSFLFVSDAAT